MSVEDEKLIIFGWITTILGLPENGDPKKFNELTDKLHEIFKITEDTSDGYHTFKELYRYRMLYNAAFANELNRRFSRAVTKSERHSDGELCFGGGWFVVTIQLPQGRITNHYEMKDWDKFNCPTVPKAPKYDGHTPEEAAERLETYLSYDPNRSSDMWPEVRHEDRGEGFTHHPGDDCKKSA